MSNFLDSLTNQIQGIKEFNPRELLECNFIEQVQTPFTFELYQYDPLQQKWVCRDTLQPVKDFFDDDEDEKRNVGNEKPIPPEPQDTINRFPDNPQPVPDDKPRPAPPPITYKNDDRRPEPRIRNDNDPLPPSRTPIIPRRRLPPLATPVTVTPVTTTRNSIVTVEESAYERFYGCLLHSPVTATPAVFRICKPRQDDELDIPDQKNELTNFLVSLIESIAGVSVASASAIACKLAIQLLPIKFLQVSPVGKRLTFWGCNVFGAMVAKYVLESYNAYQSVSGTANINVKFIECETDNTNDTDDLDGTESSPLLQPKKNNLNECFVPIRNFRDNEPEQLGMKFQLQVTYERVEEILDDQGNPTGEVETFKKQITIPSPKEIGTEPNQITKEDIKDAFPETLKFGEIKAEMDIIPYGHVRFYADEDDYDNGRLGNLTDNFFDDILDLIVDGEEKPNSRRFSRRRRSHKTGEFTRKKAFFFKWGREGKPPLCSMFDLTT